MPKPFCWFRPNTYEIYSDSAKIAVLGGLTHAIKFGWYGRREETWRNLDGTSRGSLSFSSFANFAGTCPTCNNTAQINSFRADFFNILNHTNFALASGNRVESSGTFGQLSSTAGLSGGNNGGPRVIQLTGRITF